MPRSFIATTLACSAGVLLVLLPPAAALAEPQEVRLSDYAFTAAAVAVKPGETVTWRYPVGAGEDHHNVHFDDGSFDEPATPTFASSWKPAESRTFSTPGTYRYYCEDHGGPNGQGMSGVVYVKDTGLLPPNPPMASFTAPEVAKTDTDVTFDARGTTDLNASGTGGTIVRHEWDFDGNGTFETDTGALASTSTRYSTPGPRTVKLRVTDNDGLTAVAQRQVRVTSPPTASFTAAPNPAPTGQTVTFDGSASKDPDGTIAKFEWDLNADGTFETATGTTPTTTASYPTPGERNIGLRVTDDLGVTTVTSQSLPVNAPPTPTATPEPTAMPSPTPTPPSPAGCSALTGAKRAACLQKRCRSLEGAKRATCLRKSCRSLKGAKRAACLRKGCRVLKGGKRRACVKKYARKPGR